MAANKQTESKRGRGRPEGSVNKVTAEARGAFNNILKGRAKKVGGWIDTVAKKDPAKACDLILRMAEFFIAKPQRMEIVPPTSDTPGGKSEVVFRVRRG